MGYVSINNPGNMHASTLTVGSITNGGCVTGTTVPVYGTVPASSVTIPATAGGLAGTSSITGASWSTANHSATVNIHQDGIDLSDQADVKIGSRSLKDFMDAVSDRLAILQPDPAKLEKYAALKAAYEHYRLLEKLCNEDD